MITRTRSPHKVCRSALIQSLLASNREAVLDGKGYLSEAALNLIDGLIFTDVEADLRQGDGNELGGKFRAAHSSSALAVNTFAPFKNRPLDLQLPWGAEFAKPQFERKCPHGIPGRRAPNLDVVLEGPGGIIAMESKCLEYLTPHVAKFAPAYNDKIEEGRTKTEWFKEMRRLVREPRRYRWLDAAQLVKHAFGIMHTFPDRPCTLVYLFWEPSNKDAHPVFAQHRAEVDRFAASVAGSAINFVSISYPELWKHWEDTSPPCWLPAHVKRLRARYEVAV
jgi:hypothetical protein